MGTTTKTANDEPFLEVMGTKKSKSTKIGGNDPCPCGSGKKCKSCCLHKESSSNFQRSPINSVLKDHRRKITVHKINETRREEAIIPSRMRAMKAEQVQRSVRMHVVYQADQSAIWPNIAERASRRDAMSPSMAMVFRSQ